ncbi:hypothetical protein BH23VER1_BH23VER1_16420 [soil metagenome]
MQTSLKREDTSDNPWPELPAAAPPEDADYEGAGLAEPGWVISAPTHRGDGMADDWETFTLGLLPTKHRFHEFPDAPWLFRPQNDPDGDGFINIEEYANKTDPLMPTGEMEKSDGLPPSCLRKPLYAIPAQ